MTAHRAVECDADRQAIAKPLLEADRDGDSSPVAAERATQVIEGQTNRLAVTKATVQHGKQHAGVEDPGE